MKNYEIGYNDTDEVVSFLWLENKLNITTDPVYIENYANEHVADVIKRYEAELNHYNKLIK